MIRVLLSVLLFATALPLGLWAADPVVEKAIQEAQQKYPPGDYPPSPNAIGNTRFVSPRAPVFEIHAVAAVHDQTKKWYTLVTRSGSSETLFLEPEVLLDQASIKAAWVEHDDAGLPIVRLICTQAGADKFGDLSERFLKKRIGFLFEERLIAAPVINDKITSGDVIVSRAFNEIEAWEIAMKLNPTPNK